MRRPVDLHAALRTFEELWSPRIVARFNDYDVRIAKFSGAYVWHAHADTDEVFLVLDGELTIALRDLPCGGERAVTLGRGSMFVVPRGIQHKPVARLGCSVLMIEPAGTLTVGDWHEQIAESIEVSAGRLFDA